MTTLLITHSPLEIVKNCSRCLWIDDGRLAADGDPKGILGHYVGDVEEEVGPSSSLSEARKAIDAFDPDPATKLE